MNEILAVVRLKIRDGKLDEFKRLALQYMQIVRAKDTGTLQFELYFNEDQTECLLFEKYRDLQSLLQHQDNLASLHDALAQTCSGSEGEAFAKTTPELIKALAGSGVRLFDLFQAL
jgi:quinol monooxygenase YgiN